MTIYAAVQVQGRRPSITIELAPEQVTRLPKRRASATPASSAWSIASSNAALADSLVAAILDDNAA